MHFSKVVPSRKMLFLLQYLPLQFVSETNISYSLICTLLYTNLVMIKFSMTVLVLQWKFVWMGNHGSLSFMMDILPSFMLFVTWRGLKNQRPANLLFERGVSISCCEFEGGKTHKIAILSWRMPWSRCCEPAHYFTFTWTP